MKELGIGIIGLGVVGSGVYENVTRHADEIARRTGVKPVVRKVADVDEARRKQLGIPADVFTKDAKDVLHDKSVEVVVELIGGYSPAGEFIIEAINGGKHVVTANKALLAKQGSELVERLVRWDLHPAELVTHRFALEQAAA